MTKLSGKMNRNTSDGSVSLRKNSWVGNSPGLTRRGQSLQRLSFHRQSTATEVDGFPEFNDESSEEKEGK